MLLYIIANVAKNPKFCVIDVIDGQSITILVGIIKRVVDWLYLIAVISITINEYGLYLNLP